MHNAQIYHTRANIATHLLTTHIQNINEIIISIILLEVSNEVYPDYGAGIHPSGLTLCCGLTALISFLSIN